MRGGILLSLVLVASCTQSLECENYEDQKGELFNQVKNHLNDSTPVSFELLQDLKTKSVQCSLEVGGSSAADLADFENLELRLQKHMEEDSQLSKELLKSTFSLVVNSETSSVLSEAEVDCPRRNQCDALLVEIQESEVNPINTSKYADWLSESQLCTECYPGEEMMTMFRVNSSLRRILSSLERSEQQPEDAESYLQFIDDEHQRMLSEIFKGDFRQ